METIQELWTYYQLNGSYVMEQFFRHFLMSAYGVLFAAIVGIPAGILIARYGKLSGWVLTAANLIQTIPALAMLAVLMLAMGLGANTVVMSLFLYSLLPIIRNTYTGIRSVDSSILEAGRAMGMTGAQRLFMVELPLSLSVIMAGLRTALIIAIGVATIGAFIGGGGLGSIIIRGTNVTDGAAIILAGAVPTALMAVVADIVMSWIEKALSPANQKRAAKTGTAKT
ncbi:ABC transporter permease [Bhargavaea beijingensis]|uniref:ABC transporter permease n=1 Tax=Bhargavaea beijingensis TaxID=426756 RepID=A0A1G6YQ45_9BACL|nr:ABC transporter permease [Bhargavaea beijingensis]MCW1928618.1 ABC transporter permease [Bhargavaea beijingensis]RSK36679.1 ABC transporter permease [Bhargavaea beijingensis]SDD91767.1 osmoprotectant transport system permease protein [Bhargavaea beijingensis]